MINSLVILFFILHGGLCQPVTDFRRIIGGRPAELGEFPIMARVSTPSGYRGCGGSIITERAILSAAHCFSCRPNTRCPMERIVIVGDIYVKKEKTPPSSRQTFTTNRVILHELYQFGGYLHDIAIIRLPRRIIFSKNVQPARLSMVQPQIETDCTAIGWGVVSKNHTSGSNLLLATNLQIHDPEYCKRYLSAFVKEWMICAGDNSGVNDTCRGDSGGPVIWKGQVIGIVSFGDCNITGGYTNVAKYLDWIAMNRGNSTCRGCFYVLFVIEMLIVLKEFENEFKRNRIC